MSNCDELTTLGDHLTVKGSLDIYNCKALTTLANPISVERDLNLE